MANARAPSILVLALTSAGCGVLYDVLAEAQLALDGNQAAAACVESTYLGGIIASSVTSEDPDEAAHGELKDDLVPKGCARWLADVTEPRVARVMFDDCKGPFGLKKLRGSLVAKFSQADDGSLRANLTTEDLKAGERPIDFHAVVDIHLGVGRRTAEWHSLWESLAVGGGRLRQVTDLDILLDEVADCRTFRGTAASDVDRRELVTDISKVTICTDEKGREECPNGEMIHRADDPRREVTVRFDGSKHARVDGERGDPVTLDLDCHAHEAPKPKPRGGS